VIALVIVVVALAVAVTNRSSTKTLSPPPVSIPGYTVVYAVTTNAQGVQRSTRTVSVRRPFESSDLSVPENAVAPDQGFVTSVDGLFALQGGKIITFGSQAPGVPSSDYRLSVELNDMTRLGLAEVRGQSSVAGRSCRVYRVGSPLGDPLKKASDQEYTDLCLDADGLVLSEKWMLSGQLLRDSEATSVSLAVPPTASFAAPAGPQTPNPSGVGQTTSLPLNAPPSTGNPYWLTTSPPWGFSLANRVRAVTVNALSGATDLAFVDSYVRGSDVVLVQHRERSVAGPPASGMERITAGRLGTGELTLSDEGPRASFVAGPWVITVEGSVDVAHLRAFASQLAPVGP